MTYPASDEWRIQLGDEVLPTIWNSRGAALAGIDVETRRRVRQPYALWIVSFTDRKGDDVVESREVFLRAGQHYRFLNRLAHAVAKNPRGVRWLNIDCKGVGACRMVGGA